MKSWHPLLMAITLLLLQSAHAQSSTCYGAVNNGAINDAVRLPFSGENYRVFSAFAWHLGRTFVHSKVAEVITATFSQLKNSWPDKKFMYAETGWLSGGDFSPHKTHQNGLSVDFMVPVIDSKGASVYLPVGISNQWGYDIEFDAAGKYKNYRIDFEILAVHLKRLHLNALDAGFSIKRVYFDPRLQQRLFKTKEGEFIKNEIVFNSQQAWVRHDEHYHVDFDIGCLPFK